MTILESEISQIDKENIKIIRQNVSTFIKKLSQRFDGRGKLLLDIAPQDYCGAKEFFHKSIIKTLDINPRSKSDYILDICKTNYKYIGDDYFDYILCTEVLEHTLNPFAAVLEIKRILKAGGYFFISVPFNLRIHGPLPDCWRFTEHGIRVLLKEFLIEDMNVIETNNRPLMPIHYTIIARNK